jgi:hypothetical protein
MNRPRNIEPTIKPNSPIRILRENTTRKASSDTSKFCAALVRILNALMSNMTNKIPAGIPKSETTCT